MEITSKVIRKRLKKRFPNLKNRYIQLHDPIYDLPTSDEVTVLLKQWSLEKLGKLNYIDYKGDCDKFALICHAFIAEDRMMSEDGDYAFAFGQAKMRKAQGIPAIHAINIFLTEDDIYLIEPQVPEIWTADSKQDDAFLITM
jgi:hypothetical protein